MAMQHRGERGEYEDRYRERYQRADDRDRMGWRDPDDGDRERRFGRFGRWDEDRGRMSDNMFREQTGYRGEDMYGRTGSRQFGGGREEWERGMQGYGGTQRDYQGRDWGTGGPQGERALRGGYRGKGPTGYTRSDERIREDVNDALTEDDYIDASSIDVQVKNGEVTLSGTVPDRRMKRLAEDCIDRIPGIKDVTNHIRVQEQQRDTGNGGSRVQSQSVSSSPDRDLEGGGKRPRA